MGIEEKERIKCNTIEYRKGFIEVIPNIHKGCVNIETWNVHVDIDISELSLTDEAFPEDGVTDNTEIEVRIDEVEELIPQLQRAVSKVKRRIR